MRRTDERGIALVTTLLVMLLMSALMVGYTSVVMSDQRFRGIDRDRSQAFYAAHSGLEKLTVDIANLFFVNVAPNQDQLDAASENPPNIPGITFEVADGTSGYTLRAGTPAATTIQSGPYQGLIALKTAYELHSTARTSAGGEVHLTRTLETVAIPVFQFGFFSEVDLSFSAADDFDFGGRVHSNADLFLAQGGGATNKLTLRDKVTAVGEVVRQRLSNGVSIDTSGSTRTVSMAKSTNAFRDLTRTEGSVTDGIGSSLNDPTWSNLSLSTYNSYIRNGRTGAKALNLPLITVGGTNTDLVKRPVLNEDVDSPTLFGERYFSQVSLRILLSDVANDITSLPTVTGTAPVLLDGNWNTTPPNNGTAYGPVDATHPPIARSPGTLPATTTTANTGGGDAQISVNAVPAALRPPADLRLNGTPVTCTARRADRFEGCTLTPATAWPKTVTATVDSVAVSTTTTANTVAGAATIMVASTAAFVPQSFWLNNSLVTCTENRTAQPFFRGCTGVTATNWPATVATGALSSATTNAVLTSPIGGYIKIERQDADNTWQDVTMEILNWGIAGTNLSGTICAEPNQNAIIRVQRLRDNNGTCNYAASLKGTDYWPNTLFDPREGTQRDGVDNGANLVLGGIMHYVTLDVANLSKWFAGTAPYNAGTGPQSLSNNGYSVYFSDRRNNRNASNEETGEYGFEDVINPSIANGAPDGSLQTGEDMNDDGTLDTYGQFPSYSGVANSVPPGAAAPLTTAARPTTQLGAAPAKVNRAILFRRALKLVNAGLGNIVAPGFTVATENPVYVQGHWNANAAGFGNPHVATSIVADAVMLLSTSWNDNNSYSSPYNIAGRPRSADTYYRVAIISGKGPIFPNPAGTGATFGTDGGAHSFLRFLEGTGPNPNTIHYRGSLATFYYHRQAVGPFRCCGGLVYGVPVRDYTFDTDFLNPALLPPLTPVFRDLNTLGFSQEIRPGL